MDTVNIFDKGYLKLHPQKTHEDLIMRYKLIMKILKVNNCLAFLDYLLNYE